MYFCTHLRPSRSVQHDQVLVHIKSGEKSWDRLTVTKTQVADFSVLDFDTSEESEHADSVVDTDEYDRFAHLNRPRDNESAIIKARSTEFESA